MKTLFSIVTAGILAVGAVCGLPAQADQVNIPTDLASVTNGATFTSTSGLPLTLPKDKDVGAFINQSAAATGTSNTIYGFNYQIGTNWTTTLPLKLTLACNGTTATGGYFALSRTNFYGVNAIRFDSLATSQTNTVTPASIAFDWTH